MLEIIKLIGCINILILGIISTISIHPKWKWPKEKAKPENAIMSWALGAFTNLAIGIILLLVEKFIIG